jgi:hypothetical protein
MLRQMAQEKLAHAQGYFIAKPMPAEAFLDWYGRLTLGGRDAVHWPRQAPSPCETCPHRPLSLSAPFGYA